MQAKILILEGKRASIPSLVSALSQKGFEVKTVTTGKAALETLPVYEPDVVIIDAPSLRSSGKRICTSLREVSESLAIMMVVNSDQNTIEGDGLATVVLTLPFTPRKLLNRLKPLLPGENKKTISSGAISLDVSRRIVRCDGREAQLTPRLMAILQLFLKQPGVVLERELIFRNVWKTEYTADTRTLDVHISWLREKIEEDPHKPKFLKTIRGVGYRLDL